MDTMLNTRRLKVKGDSSGVYHCMTRVVAGERLLGVQEREVLRRQLHQLADFCGVQVLTYCILSNHFHVLVRVPPESETLAATDEELIRRIRVLYPKDRAAAWVSRLQGDERETTRERLLARMGDVSMYMRELKHRFSIWYNRSRGRFGTLWAERFKSVLVEPSGMALLAVACYIDLNAVRAGLCEDPKDYRWCGYAEACAGSGNARAGLLAVLQQSRQPEWRQALKDYRLQLFGRAHPVLAGKEEGIPLEKIDRVKARKGDLSLPQLLRCRVRYFTAGTAIGSKAYVESILSENTVMFGRSRKGGAKPIRAKALSEVFSLRDLQSDVFG